MAKIYSLFLTNLLHIDTFQGCIYSPYIYKGAPTPLSGKLLLTKASFLWSWVPETILSLSYLGQSNFKLISLKIHLAVLGTGLELSCLVRQGNSGKWDFLTGNSQCGKCHIMPRLGFKAEIRIREFEVKINSAKPTVIK